VRCFLKRGYPRAVVDALEAISRREGERYGSYIERVAANPLAVRVKLADLNDSGRARRCFRRTRRVDTNSRGGICGSCRGAWLRKKRCVVSETP